MKSKRLATNRAATTQTDSPIIKMDGGLRQPGGTPEK
jgi:hypothetical protein